MTGKEYAVEYGLLSGAIFAGELDKEGKRFVSKTDQTNNAIRAVSLLVERKYDGEVTFTGNGRKISITVEEV